MRSPSKTQADTAVPKASAARETCLSGVLTLTLRRASDVTGISIATLRRHEQAARLVFIKVGGRTLVDARSLETLLFGKMG